MEITSQADFLLHMFKHEQDDLLLEGRQGPSLLFLLARVLPVPPLSSSHATPISCLAVAHLPPAATLDIPVIKKLLGELIHIF